MRLKRVAKWTAGMAVIVFVVTFAIAYVMSDNDCDQLGVGGGERMRAVVYCEYGLADVLRLEQIAKPVPVDHEVLVRVHAASINPLDWHYMRGTPRLMRIEAGLRKPKFTRMGVDFAGTVEAVGPAVTLFKPGDEVFGGKRGALADYVCTGEDRAITLKPASLTFEQAAAIPIAGVTALQALRDKGKAHPGQKILINGASGGVGTFAVQIAKTFGAEVTGVCSTRNLEMVRALGADRVVDYTKDDFVKLPERYDLVLDNVGNRPLLDFKRVLEREGTYVMIGGGGPNEGTWIGPMARPIKGLLLSPFVSQRFVMLLADLNKNDLARIADLMQAGKVTSVIDRRYPLGEAAAAIRYLEEGHARGKVIVTMDEPPATAPPPS